MTRSEIERVPFRPSKQSGFTTAQKWALLIEYDKCLDRGAKADFCRRIGVWSGTPVVWHRARAEGKLRDPATVNTMSKPGKLRFTERQELEQLRRENERLRNRLDQSDSAVEVLGKAAALLEALAKSAKHSTEAPLPDPQPGRPDWLQGPDTSKLPQIPPWSSSTPEQR